MMSVSSSGPGKEASFLLSGINFLSMCRVKGQQRDRTSDITAYPVPGSRHGLGHFDYADSIHCPTRTLQKFLTFSFVTISKKLIILIVVRIKLRTKYIFSNLTSQSQ